MQTEQASKEETIYSLRYTARASHVVACTSSGFRIVCTQTGELKRKCNSFEGGLLLCAPLG